MRSHVYNEELPALKARIFRTHPDAIIPSRKSEEAAGYDLHCIEDFSILPGQRVLVKTGLVVQPPPGYHTEVFGRSGNALKYGIMLANNIGLIDRDYAGPKDEIGVMLYMVPAYEVAHPDPHHPRSRVRPQEVWIEPLTFKKGDRIAQLVFRKTEVMEFEEVDSAPLGMDRGGFGSTGVSK